MLQENAEHLEDPIADLFPGITPSEKFMESRTAGRDPTHMMEALNKSGNDEFVPIRWEMPYRPTVKTLNQILYGVSSPNIVQYAGQWERCTGGVLV